MQRRRRDPSEPKAEREERPAPAPPAAAAPLLALQRSAGNAAVSAYLARKGRSIPDDADTLEDVASAAPAITIDTDVVTIGSLDQWVKADRGNDRKGFSVDIRIAEPMASQPKVRKALTALAMTTFNLRDGATQAAQVDTVRLVDLDFSAHGGTAGHYRFTCVTAKPAARGKPAAVDMIIELVRPQREAFKDWAGLDRARRTALGNRFSQFSFVKAQRELLDTDPVDEWLDDQWAKVLQALERIPDAALSAVPGIRWVRGHGPRGKTGEDGYFAWDPKGNRTLTLYDNAFAGSDESLVGLVAHELGHALSAKPPTEKKGAKTVAASDAWKKAVAADGGKPITDYGTKNAEENYADAYSMFVTEPETMRVLRPKLFEFFTNNPSGQPPPPPPAPPKKKKETTKKK
jgi:hypothetical protein